MSRKLPDQSGMAVVPRSQRSVGVLAADLVGYSELVYNDTLNGFTILRDSRNVLVDAIFENGGEVVQTPGDFVLALFSKLENVLPAAVAAQQRLFDFHRKRNDFASGHWKIGLECGEVFEIDGDYFGNCINVAARLQALAGPGEIWFTGAIPRLDTLPPTVSLTSIGTPQLKNIGSRPQVSSARIPDYEKRLSQVANKELTQIRLEDRLSRPTLFVKPFTRIGRDKKGEFLGQALVAEVRLILARLAGSIVLTNDQELGLPKYVLYGSVQTAGDTIRIVSQLVSTADGAIFWADRFEFDLRETFDLQDRIAQDIVSALQLTLTEGEQAQLWRRGTASGRAWEAFQRGHDFERRYTRQGHRNAKRCYGEALSIDPRYLSALVALGFCHLDELRLGWSENDDVSLSAAARLCENALAIADDHPDALALKAYVAYLSGDEISARVAMEEAVDLAPQSPEIIGYEGALLDLMGDFRGAVRAYREAISLSHHSQPWIAANLALTLLALDENIEAEAVLREVVKHYRDYARAWIGLAVALVRQGRTKEANAAAKQLMALDRHFTVGGWAKSKPFSDLRILDRFVADLRAAGLN